MGSAGSALTRPEDPGHDFGVALVGASAALLGLIIVVVSLHLKAVVSDSVLRRRAEILLGLFATTLAASAARLIPGQSRQALGIESDVGRVDLLGLGLRARPL